MGNARVEGAGAYSPESSRVCSGASVRKKRSKPAKVMTSASQSILRKSGGTRMGAGGGVLAAGAASQPGPGVLRFFAFPFWGVSRLVS